VVSDTPAAEGGAPVRSTFLVFGSPLIGEEEIREVEATLRSGWIGTGPRVARFEEEFRAYQRAEHAVAVASCTAGLHLSLLTAGIGPGDEVITTPMAFCATANAIIHAGGRPVFVDCERDTMNIDPGRIAGAVSNRTRAIVPVHFAGLPCEMDAIMDVARRHGLKVVEDCAHAIETEYRGRKMGTIGDMGCFSFYATKNVVTAEGGMVVTNDAKAAARLKVLALHGMSEDAWKRHSDAGFKHYDVVECGFKYNMTDIQAAIGLPQLRRVETNWTRRRQIWTRYNEEFRDLPCRTPAEPPEYVRHGYHLYTLLLDLERLRVDRDAVLAALAMENIGTGVHYRALHLQPYYSRRYGYRAGDFQNAEWISERTVSLPLSAKLGDADADDVIRAVRKVLTHYRR
jgi:dTDP-4-amino-4,6-dideoxygalactose transaminase